MFDPKKIVYLEVPDTTLRLAVEASLSKGLLEKHSVSEILRMSDGKWLIKLSPDVAKTFGKPSQTT